MAQGPLNISIAQTKSGPGSVLTTTSGGHAWAAVTATGSVKATAGRLARITVIAPGTAGNLTIEDSVAGGAGTFYESAFGTLVEGQVIILDWPCLNGIYVSSIPTGGSFAIAYA